MKELNQTGSHRAPGRHGEVGDACSPGTNALSPRATLKPHHASANGKSRPSRRLGEASDDYPHIVTMLDANTRVIECAQGIQWIIQKRRAGRWPWRNRYFCRTKMGLLQRARPIVPELLALPDHFARRTDREWIDRPSEVVL